MLAVVVTIPWTKQRGALPFVCILATTSEVSERLGTRHTTVGMWAHQMISPVRRWLPGRPITRMGETASTIPERRLHATAQQVVLMTTGRLDAVLHEPPYERPEHTSGRTRVFDHRHPSLEPVVQNPETAWQKLTLDW